MHLEAALGPTGSAVPPSPQPESGTPRLGTTLGRYVIERRLGQGGMGAVYAARDPELDRKVALKLLHPGLAEPGSQARARLRREAQSLARLSHPAVVGIHDVGTAGDHVFIAMELVEGSTLSQWLDRARRTVPQILEVFVRAGEGLAAAHRAGLVHRDFKPDNVIVSADGRVRVVDFGLARTIAHEPPDVDASASISQAGDILGTPGYMSPEQYAGRPASARTDQFCFCVSLFEALHGLRPFPGGDPLAVAAQTVLGQVRRVRTPGVSARLDRIVRRGLNPGPQDRFPSMPALLGELAREALVRRRGLVGRVIGAAVMMFSLCASMLRPVPPQSPHRPAASAAFAPKRAAGARMPEGSRAPDHSGLSG